MTPDHLLPASRTETSAIRRILRKQMERERERRTERENKKAQLSLTNPRDAIWRIVVYGVGVFFV